MQTPNLLSTLNKQMQSPKFKVFKELLKVLIKLTHDI